MTIDQRRFERLDLSRLAFAREGDQAHGGVLRDISLEGAFIEFRYPLGRVEHQFKQGDAIELLLDDETLLTGTAIRIETEGIALQFAADNSGQRQVLEALMAAEA